MGAFRDSIDNATDGLIAKFGPSVLNTCPHAATRLGVLQCRGCSWHAVGSSSALKYPLDGCAMETIVGVQDDAVKSNFLFIALIAAGIIAIFVLPQRNSEAEELGAELSDDGLWVRSRNGVLSMRPARELPRASVEELRISKNERARLSVLWLLSFVGNYAFAFLLTHFVICEAGGVVQTHDATVISLQVGLWVYTMWRFHFPSGRLLASRPLLKRCGGWTGKVLGRFIMWVLGILVLVAWVLSRRFTEGEKIWHVLQRRHDAKYYNLCFAGADGFSDVARPTTVLQYFKGILQLGSALIFLLGGFGRVWFAVRVLNLLLVYATLVAQFAFGKTVMATTGFAEILTGALANDFLEIAIAHALVVVGLCEVWEMHALSEGCAEGSAGSSDIAPPEVEVEVAGKVGNAV